VKNTIIPLLVLLFSCAPLHSNKISSTPPSLEVQPTAQEMVTVEQMDQEVDESQEQAEEIKMVSSAPDILQNGSVDWNAEERADNLPLKYDRRMYQMWINYFSGRGKDTFIRHLQNGEAVKKTIFSILEREGVPSDLYYVGLIESGYNKKIRSRAAAVGPWQFIKETARIYGLRVDNLVDERMNIYKATVAAAHYFRDLHNIFGSWELALCAYNAGEYGIIRAIRKGKTRDYKELVERRLIPRETIYYIPKVVAAREISFRPQVYQLPPVEIEGNFYQQTVNTAINASFSLEQISKDHNIPLNVLRILNTDIKGTKVAASPQRPFTLYLPETAKAQLPLTVRPIRLREVEKEQQLLAQSERHYKKTGPTDKNKFVYTVRRGDNLTKIARRFGIDLRSLVAANKIRGGKVFPGQKLKSGERVGGHKVYTVQKGDSLERIAKKFKTSVKALMRMNELAQKNIFYGQKIRIPL
jgi:membrane-bound lytic murein transglycosylase D